MTTVQRFFAWMALGLSACATAQPAAAPLGGTTLHASGGSAKRGLDPTKVDAPKLETLIDQRIDEAIARPAFNHAIEELLTSLTDDQALAAQGNALWESLGNDPQLAARAAAFQDSWSEEPAMVAFVMRLMAEHPGASSDQIGDLAGEHIARQTGSSAFDQAFDFAADRLFERPKLKAAFDGFGKALANNPQFERGVGKALHAIDYGPLAERVIAFNGGTEPDAAGATQILVEHAFTTDRLEELMLSWLNLPEVRSELRQLASAALAAPSFRKRVVAVSLRLLSEPDVQQGLRDCFLLLLDAHPEPAAMKALFRKTLDTPRVDAILASFVVELTQDPALKELGSRYLERVTNEQAFAASMQRFVIDW